MKIVVRNRRLRATRAVEMPPLHVWARARAEGGVGTREGPRFALFRRKRGRSGRSGARGEDGAGRRGRREKHRETETLGEVGSPALHAWARARAAGGTSRWGSALRALFHRKKGH